MDATFETQRVADHIAGAEMMAALRDTSGLSHLQRLVRQLLLQELTEYRREGRFPQNRDFPERPMPYFVDADGTRCAMAHLLELGGAGDLVARIAAENNNGFVRELASYPELLTWLEAAGISVAEAERIQPSYCQVASECVCGGPYNYRSSKVVGAIEATVLSSPGSGSYTAHVDALYGTTPGVSVGEKLIVSGSFPVGYRMLIPITEQMTADAGADASADAGDDAGTYFKLLVQPIPLETGHASCPYGSYPATPTQIASAMTGADCPGTLAAIDPVWSTTVGCSDKPSGPSNPAQPATDGGADAGTNTPSSDDSGCAMSPVSDPSAMTLQVFLAVLSAIAGRRLLRRARA